MTSSKLSARSTPTALPSFNLWQPDAMKTLRPSRRRGSATLVPLLAALTIGPVLAGQDPGLEVGIAVRDITPEVPIRLAGYAGRNRPADKVDHPLVVQALALKNPTGERFVFVALDNCEVSGAFMQPVS